MGSGSSRSGRALRRLRGPDSRPAGPGGAASEGGTGPLFSATPAAREEAPQAAAEAAEGAAGPDPGPAAPGDGRDETLRLLDQLLAESAAWGAEELASRGPARPRPAAGAGGLSPVSVVCASLPGVPSPTAAPGSGLCGASALAPRPRCPPAALSLLLPPQMLLCSASPGVSIALWASWPA